MDKISLTPRLAAIAAFVPHGAMLCDVGADHGQLSAYLAQSGCCSRIAASDLRADPLSKAKKTAARAAVDDVIDFRLCSGVPKDLPWQHDTVVIAGMGGDTIWQILSETDVDNVLFILQPQTCVPELLVRMAGIGLGVLSMVTVQDEGWTYQIFAVKKGQGRLIADPVEAAFLPLVMGAEHGRFLAQREVRRLTDALAGLSKGTQTPARLEQRRQLELLIKTGEELLDGKSM